MQSPEQRLPWTVIGVLAALLAYSYWPSLAQLPSFWDNPQYQHGWIVPVFTVLLLFWWRKPVGPVTTSARAAGVGLLLLSFVMRLWCASFRIVTLDMYTFVPALMGVFLLAGGWSMFRWSWAPIASLIFMYPLPDEATRYLLGPLQTVATIVSTYSLQTLGLDAYRDGNRIILGDGQVLGVVDACSGLKMLTIFVWLAVMLMLVGGLEWWENLVIAASAIPIALVCNAFRITTVGVMYNFNDSLKGLSTSLAGISRQSAGGTLDDAARRGLFGPGNEDSVVPRRHRRPRSVDGRGGRRHSPNAARRPGAGCNVAGGCAARDCHAAAVRPGFSSNSEHDSD